MRLRTQIFASGLLATLVCTLLGSWVLGAQTARSAEVLLDGQLRVGELALRRHWQGQREQRRAVYEAVTNQTFLRAYLGAGDREQMAYFVELAKQKGADVAAITDRGGQILSSDGAGAEFMATALAQRDWPAGGELLAVPSARGGPAQSELVEVLRLPIGEPKSVGYLLVGHRLTDAVLHKDADPLGVLVSVHLDDARASTLPGAESLSLLALQQNQSPELERLQRSYHIQIAPSGRAMLLIGVPLTAVRAFAVGILRPIALILVVLLLLTLAVSQLTFTSITRPLRQLSEVAGQLGGAKLVATRYLPASLLSRQDEIGILSRSLESAAKRLADVMQVGHQLAEQLGDAALALDQSATSVQRGAHEQEEQIQEVAEAISPLQQKIDRGLNEISALIDQAIQMSMSLSAFAHGSEAPIDLKKSTRHLGGGSASRRDGHHELAPERTVQTFRGQFGELREGLQRIRDTQFDGQRVGRKISMTASGMARVAKRHADDAQALRVSAEHLRGTIRNLSELLQRLQRSTSSDAIGLPLPSAVSAAVAPAAAAAAPKED